MNCLARVLIASALLIPPLRAAVHPNTAGGFPTGQAASSGGLDSVNLFNGSLTLSIPIGPSYPVNGGFSYGIQLVYNSSPWVFETVNRFVPALEESRDFTSAYPNPCANAGMGWRVSFGRINPPCQAPDSNTPGFDIYQDEAGTDHVFYPSLHPEAPPSGGGVQYSRDGSYLRLKASGGTYRLEFPDGSYRLFNAAGLPTEVRDAFGNGFGIDYSVPNQWILTDSTGRIHTIFFRTDMSPFPQVVHHVDVTAFGTSVRARYDFVYSTAQVGRPCPHNDNSAPGARGDVDSVPFLTGINRPDGSSYFVGSTGDYLTTPAAGCTPSGGNLLALNLPNGAEYRYTWQTYRFPTGSASRLHVQQNPGVALRQINDPVGGTSGTWTYQTSTFVPLGPELKNTVVDPLGHKSEYFFSVALDGAPASPTGRGPGDLFDYGLPFTRQTSIAGATLFLASRTFENSGTVTAPSYSASPRRSEYVAYERDPVGSNPNPPHIYNTNRRLFRSRTVFDDDGGAYAQVVASDFDGLGHYRRQESTGSGFLGIPGPGTVLRKQTSQYNPLSGTYFVDVVNNTSSGDFAMPATGAPWVLETLSFSKAEEGGQVAQTDFCFHPDSARVTRTRLRRSLSGALSANDFVTSVDLTENVPGLGAVVRGNPAIERSYGGDGAGQAVIATGSPNLCTMALPATADYQVNSTYSGGVRATSQYNGFTFKFLDQTIDGNTGLPASSRDSAGLQTDFEYDSMGRLTWTKPALGHGGWTQNVYAVRTSVNNLTPGVTVYQRNNGSQSAGILAESKVELDGLSRLSRERKTLPGGVEVKRETKYDGAGHRVSVSEWFSGATPPGKTVFTNYDPFGRPRQVVPPDGAAHAVDLAYTGVRRTDRTVRIATALTGAESAVLTTEIYDRFGRLKQVLEPSGDAGVTVTTTYGYDVGSRLTSTSTPAAVAGVNFTQSRSFTYDAAGLLSQESHPEKSVAVTYPSYDSRAHLLRKNDGGSQLAYAYDRAERLTEIREATGAQRVLKSFQYAGANGSFTDPVTGTLCTDNRKAKLTQQSRFNYVTIFGSPYTVEIREGMTYCGRDGRVSRTVLENRVNGAVTPNESFVLPFLGYDALGDLTSESYPQCTHSACAAPAPRTVISTYTKGYLTSVGLAGAPQQYATSISYHPNGMVHQAVHNNDPAVPSRALTDTYALPPNGMQRPASIATTTASAVQRWSTGNYAYDGAGNVKTIGSSAFAYDRVSRLTSATLVLDPVGAANLRNQSYTYDAYGNLLSMAGSVGRTTPTHAASNRMNSAGTNYDLAGNVIAWSGNQYEYDPFHLMWHYKTAGVNNEWFYLYSADDERVWSYRADNTSLWTLREPGGTVLREYTSAAGWAVQSDYIYREGALLAAETPNGIRHFHLDHLGTPRLISDSLGTQKAYHVYYPYGEEVTAIGQDSIRTKFTGHERDFANPAGQGDDLDYMHARFHNPIVGRFWSIDPEEGRARFPQSWNRYTYVLGNPLTLVDPDGRQEVQPYYNIISINIRPSDTLPFATATAADTLLFGGIGLRATLALAAAQSGPAILVTGAGLLGYGAGTLINKIPGVSGAITTSLGVVIEPFMQAQDSGGGKTGRKTSKDNRENGRRLIEETRELLDSVVRKPNKTPADKQVRDTLEKRLKKLIDNLRKSEEHAKAGQGYK